MNVKSTIHWATPYSLGLLLALGLAALAGFALWRWASGRPIAPARRAGLLVVRLAILAILGLIIVQPRRVDETPGAVERPKLFYLLDTSQSMAIGKGPTRWDQVVANDPDRRRGSRPSQRSPGQHVPVREPPGRRERGVLAEAGTPSPPLEVRPAPCSPPSLRAPPSRPRRPTDSDTLLSASLEGLADRFGQAPASGGRRLLRRPRARPRPGRSHRPRL